MENEIYPEKIARFHPINARLGIKSSFKNAKRNIALLILLWLCNGELSSYNYFESQDNMIVFKEKYTKQLFKYIDSNLDDNSDQTYKKFVEEINNFELVRSQLEPIQVAFQLVWRLAEVNFEDENFPDGKERTGSNRYPKIITYTSNIDLIKDAFIGQEEILHCILIEWLLSKSNISFSTDNLNNDLIEQAENKLIRLLSILSDRTAFKIVQNDKKIIFQKNGIYQAIVKNGKDTLINISGDEEIKGPLRIMSVSIKNNIEPFLEETSSPSGHVKIKNSSIDRIKNYTKRVLMNLKLSDVDLNAELEPEKQLVKSNQAPFSLNIGKNIIYYGAPGTGKSYGLTKLIRTNGIDDYDPKSGNNFVERITLHPEYTYSDFVGQIMPVIKPNPDNSGKKQPIDYDFQPGDFTRTLKKAFDNKDFPIFLVMEEMSRANVAAVFGDLFQLLDRNKDGYSEYAINNPLIARYVFQNENETSIFLPPNLMIIGTVNTSDQNVFAMDTAFKRRFEWRYVSTIPKADFNNNPKISVIDQDGNKRRVFWKIFFESLNEYIVNNLNLSEDKQIGPYFIKFLVDDTVPSEERIKYNDELIKNKLLQYLWEDVATVSSMTSEEHLFAERISSFASLYSNYEINKTIFSDSFLTLLEEKGADSNNEES